MILADLSAPSPGLDTPPQRMVEHQWSLIPAHGVLKPQAILEHVIVGKSSVQFLYAVFHDRYFRAKTTASWGLAK